MNLQTLINQFESSPLIADLASRLLKNPTLKIHLKNLAGSSVEFIIHSVASNKTLTQQTHLVIMNDEEEALYTYNTLENIDTKNGVFFFPASFKKKKNFRLLNPSNIILRAEMLTEISKAKKPTIIVAYPEALFEKVVPPATLQENLISLKVNETIQLESLLELLTLYGFKKTEFVYEPGQFALRGGILDIYSFGGDKPYRVELAGNTIDSLRIFDVETQVSEKKITSLSIVPNVDTHFAATEKINLLQAMPNNSLVWIRDKDIVQEKMLQQEKDLREFLNNSAEATATENWEDEDHSAIAEKIQLTDFVFAAEWEKHYAETSTIEIGQKASLAEETIVFDIKPQLDFNKQFDLLIQNLQTHQAQGYSLYIFSEQVQQLNRLESIFSDLKADIPFIPIPKSIHEGFVNHDIKALCYTDHQIFQRYHKYKLKRAFNKNQALTLKALRDLQPGDYVTHIDHGVGRYSGLEKITVNGTPQEAIRIIYKDNDILYVNINALHKIAKFIGKDATEPKIHKLGSDAWNKLKEKTKIKVKTIAFDLIKLYARRKAQKGFAYSADNYMQTELEASFQYEDTPDQSKANIDIKKDMEMRAPMDRLVCGDVGFGKTELAIRAAFKSCCDNKQVVILVPTTILAFQHFKTFKDRLKDFPVTVDYLNRFKSAKAKKETLEQLANGKIDIIIGTHSLLGKATQFKDLGLIIVDEEQKFGVEHKEKLKLLKTNVDTLTLTATPIPRTLQFSLMGARDLSIINTPPPNRQPILTELQNFNLDKIREAIYYEVQRGGQVFFIHNRVQGLAEMAGLIQKLCPELSIAYAHGQMEGHELEGKIMDFIDKKYDVLVSTNIVESGIDISNANTIIINNAHQFGLSDLHQLRGRVGRNNKKAFCYLIAPLASLPNDSRKRLQILEQFSELGSGFQIAMRDLDIRGAGNMLGAEQSGFIAEIGLETYQKILAEAVRELKHSTFKEIFQAEISQQQDFVQDCNLDTDLEILIPDEYIEDITERLSIYTRLDNSTNKAALDSLKQELEDRFGTLPPQVENLLLAIQSRWIAIKIGFEKMQLKDNMLRCYFINKPDSPYFETDAFKNVLNYVQTMTNKASFKQTPRHFFILIKDMRTIEDIYHFLLSVENYIQEKGSII